MIDKYYGHVGTTVTILAFIVTGFVPEQYRSLSYSIAATIAIAWLAFYLGRKTAAPSKSFDDSLIDFFRRLSKQQQHQEILRLGDALSTPVWLSLKYSTRIAVGQCIDNSAIIMKNSQARIRVLIDDIGWTSVELGLYEDGENSIMRGIEVATEYMPNHAFISKGNRHLCGLYARQGRTDDAQRYLNKASDAIANLPDGPEKDGLLSEIHFSRSSLALIKKDYNAALNEIRSELASYENAGNKVWTLKALARKGEILFHQGNRQAAKECFIEGLAQAETYHYNKQIVKNLIGLSNCSMDQNVAEARTFLSRAAAIAEEVGMYHEKKTLQAAFERLQKYIDSVRGA